MILERCLNSSELIGTYFVLKYRTRIESHQYELKLFKGSDCNLLFSLELKTIGQFGSVGTEWEGECKLNNNLIEFIFNKKNDWRFTFLEDEMENCYKAISKHYIGQIYLNKKEIFIKISLEVFNLVLYKYDLELMDLIDEISRAIIRKFDLNNNKNYNGIGKYWRIFNLILNGHQTVIVDGQDLFEPFCEHDIDSVMEEKRVVNCEDFERDHYSCKIIFNDKCEIIKFNTFY